MAIVELERSEPEVEELERLWNAPAARRAGPRRVATVLSRATAVGWAALVVAVVALSPAPSPEAVAPIWAEALVVTFWTGLMAAAMLAWFRIGGAALAVSAFAGLLGVGLGYACRATEHHLGAWWIAEAGACGALAALSIAALLARR
jgi:hypothetical protein